MRRSVLLIATLVMSAFLFVQFTPTGGEDSVNDLQKTEKFMIPEDIQPIIKKSCYGCHNTESKNDKAKAKLQFDELEKMPKAKLFGTLSKINEVVTKKDMPPTPFLERFPDAKPTDEEIQKLATWSGEESSKMMKKKK
jgi:hypothetical protein